MINKLYRSKLYPLVMQIVSFTVFALLIAGAIGVSTSDAKFAIQLRNTNLSNLIVWSYWWPLIVLTAVFFGRHWCSICPMELISAVTVRLGFKRKVPKFIKSGWVITIFYAFVAIVAISTWGIHRYPNRMAFYLLGLMSLTLLVSLLFEKRAFCSYFCPVGKLLGLYSLMTKWGLRVKSKDVCSSCKTKDCISKKNNSKLIGRSCQSGLFPAKLEDNRSCILCSQCVKACSNNNIGLKTERKSNYLSFVPNKLSMAEVGMVTILVGFVCYEIMSSWQLSKHALMSIPNFVAEYVGKGALPAGLFKGLVLYLLVPFFFLMIITSLSRLTGKLRFESYLKRSVLFILPVVAFGHVFKALLKTSSRLPYWKYALDKPKGIEYAQGILDKDIVIHQASWLSVLVIVLGLLGLVYALQLSIRKIKADEKLSLSNRFIYYGMICLYMIALMYGPVSDLI